MLSRFLTLSPELLVQIISYLPFKDIISCQASCPRLNGVVKSSFLLKYLKEAGRTGVFDPLDTGFTFPERLERLRLWEKSWEDLDIPESSARITFDLNIWSPLIGSLHNGHLIVTDADPVVYASSDISSLPVASPVRSIELGNLTLIREGLLHVFAFADEYDLVAIVSTCVSSYAARIVLTLHTHCSSEAKSRIARISHMMNLNLPPSSSMFVYSRSPNQQHIHSPRTHASASFSNHGSFYGVPWTHKWPEIPS
ncbi:hypothetical protein F5148DRAFT_808787 [Russula earlei]|uniref:Uncharacterized protein n=1 Tax=Russula earlei TaxID=71964 RepID=A0ACC0UBL5_9AGAM|nr:hypothetical protein F5148DRAFT_808787 [Russula earlei]